MSYSLLNDFECDPLKAYSSFSSIRQFKTVPAKRIRSLESVNQLVIGSYNVLFGQKSDNHTHAFSSSAGYNVTRQMEVVPNTLWRLELKIKNILNANPNCLALQEVTDKEYKAYIKSLGPAGYAGALCLHNNSFHGVAIFYKSDQFSLVGAYQGEFNCLSLSKSRNHLLLDLQDKNSGLIVRMVSCHLLDPRNWGSYHKSRHLEAVVAHSEFMAHYIVDVVAICGDMNQDQFGDDVTICQNLNPQPVKLSEISAFVPILLQYVHDNCIEATEYKKDISKKDGEMISTNRKTDWIFFKIKRSVEMQSLSPISLSSVKITHEKPNLQKNEIDLRGSDHALILNEIQIKRISF